MKYKTDLSNKMEGLLREAARGEIRRVKVAGRLGVAFAAGEGDRGLLTVSRSVLLKPPSESEIRRVLTAFREAGERLARPVLMFRELSREEVGWGDGRYHVVRFSVYFGEQGRLFCKRG